MQGPTGNLLITYDPAHREAAEANARSVLDELSAGARFLGNWPGVFEVAITGDPRLVVQNARALCRSDPSRFNHTHHWRPVDAWARSELPDMAGAAQKLGAGIAEGETWKLSLAIHGPSRWRAHDLVKPLTDPVKRGPVRLDDPAKELRVDVLGERTAVALLERGEDLSVDKVREATLAMPQDV